MQETQINLFAKTMEEVEQEEFISILHHDANKRSGMFVRMDKRESEIHEKWSSKNAFPLMTMDAAYNRYIALNSYHNIKETVLEEVEGKLVQKEVKTLRRKGTHLHAITTVYLDLDWHDGTRKEIEERVNNTKALLESTYQENKLPRPTMITETGRGLGIFYVLDNSIANSQRTGKQIKFWEYIYREYAKKYEEIFGSSEKELLEVDFKVVGDKARVVRLPGTKNLNTNTFCRLTSVARKEDGSPLYYSMKELVQYIENYNVYEKSYKEIKKQISKKKIVNFSAYNNPFLVARLEKLKRAQEKLQIDKIEGYREQLCFIYYNTAKQLMTEEEAFEEMLQFNQEFTYPITDMKELRNIIVAVAGATDLSKNPQGYYKYTDAKIKEVLKITDDQNEYVGLGVARKEMLRKQKKEENRKKKQERNEHIISYVVEHPAETYEEIAGLFGVSIRTLKNILKEADVHRYQKQVDETSISAEQIPHGEDEVEKKGTDNIIQFAAPKSENSDSREGNKVTLNLKVQKNAHVSRVCCLGPKGISISNNHLDINGNIITEISCNQKDNLYAYRNRNDMRTIPEEDAWHLLNEDELCEVPFLVGWVNDEG